ncbi:MBL fold metallo-hydrolase [Cognatishimia activa]|uniref:MBL fold metallo-hydrolase n=1 Tax=Cognatishimia activa TaxID=1715691 RepID=A0A975ENH0_9RHOB|nr:MBL fold metallo-hydrolase [Cognatishimia activa]QTN35363.1 MBL fold metallo-hydrolase [Cognatishimia activa]
MTLNRRTFLASGVASAALASPLAAAAPKLGVNFGGFHRVTLGDFEITTLAGGTRVVEEPQKIFGLNVSADDFAAASSMANIPADRTRFYFTPVLVNTGSELVLFDAGLNGQATLAQIEAAGYTADQIDKVIITHMHGDHIGGLMGDAGETFAGAEYVSGAAENNFWAGQDNKNYKAKVMPLAEKFSFVSDGASVASGITAMDASGHTPGHMAYMLESNGASMLLGADFANHYVWSLGYPDWEVRFDMDKSGAAARRRQILDMLATDKIPFTGYHMPFPAIGYVSTRGDGFEYEPATYQLTL